MKRLLPVILTVFLLSADKPLYAQVSATNTGTLYITGSSDIFYAVSDFTNNSGSALTNNGQIYIKGNLSNAQSAMAIGTGTLYLNGTTAQSLNGTQPFKTYHLNTNNSTGITLNNNLSVSGIHTFTNGMITTSATPNYLIYEAGSSYAGDGDTKHVNGWVKKFGSTNFIFPVGDATYERTIALNSLSGSSEFNVKYFTTTPNTSQMQIPVRQVDAAEYWLVNKVSGGSATVTLNWNYSKVYFPNWIVSDIMATGYNGSLWTDNGGVGTASGNTATTGTVTSSSISAFNLFTFANQSWILPLTLISFNARLQDNYTQINWTTEREYNADHFIVERSNNGVSFYTVTQSPGRNTNNTELYTARDNEAIQHIAYYRLRSVDTRGKETLSRIVVVKVTNRNDGLAMLTNPVHDQVTLIAGNQLNGVFNYHIHSINGQLVQEGKLTMQNGGQYTIPFKRIPEAGTYTLDINNGIQRFRYKVLVQ